MSSQAPKGATPPNAASVAEQKPVDAKAQAALSGAVKAALWLLSADEEVAVGTLQLLSHDEVRRIRQVAETLQKVSPQELARVHHEFKYILEQQPLRLRGSVHYLGRLANRAYGDATARELLRLPEEQIPASMILGASDTQLLGMNLREEHPQIIAAVLSTMEPARVSSLLAQFAMPLRDEVVSRLATLKRVPTESLARAQRHLSQSVPSERRSDSTVDGVRLMATALNEAGEQEAERMLKALGAQSDALAVKVREAMFVFADLERLDKRGVQTLLKEVPSDRLTLALRGVSDSFKEKIFSGMSMRAAEMMREEMDTMGPVKIADVEAAQRDIVGIASKLRDDNKITLGGAGAQAGFL